MGASESNIFSRAVPSDNMTILGSLGLALGLRWQEGRMARMAGRPVTVLRKVGKQDFNWLVNFIWDFFSVCDNKGRTATLLSLATLHVECHVIQLYLNVSHSIKLLSKLTCRKSSVVSVRSFPF